jgi:hypothetical protein
MTWSARRGKTADVFLVGAGFSIAAAGNFPDTNALGAQVLERDGTGFDGIASNVTFSNAITFENWLTRLAEKQPYDSEEDRLKRASLFARSQNLIADVLLDSLKQAATVGLPSWLFELVEVLHLNRSAVLTLNYDTLIEQAIGGARLYSRGGDTRADANRALNYIQIPIGTWDSLSPRTTLTVKLYKLHGSVDWYWVPGDMTGTTLMRQSGKIAQSQAAGRSRYIVPPTSTKSSYFDNAVSRHMWAESARSLRDCRRVFLFGYSLPITDTAIAAMIAEQLNPEAEVVIADLHPERVASNLIALGVDRSRIREVEGLDAIEATVADLLSETRSRVLSDLRAHLSEVDDLPMTLHWDRKASAAITQRSSRAAGTLTLVAESIGDFHAQVNRSRSSSVEVPMTTHQLRDLLGDVSEINVTDETGRTWPIVDFGVPTEAALAGHSTRWYALKGAGQVTAAEMRESKPFDLRNQPRVFTQPDPPEDAEEGDIWQQIDP